MVLSAGTRLGPYEIRAHLAAGGMGEVYVAHDTKLNRDVALKVLLAAVANDPDRLARFKREAQVLASLNHPNIAQIYGFEDSGDVRALVMELVEGPTLADRIAGGAIPLDEALPIATQIAEALESAHEHGIIHRDLKPSNVKVRVDGTVKVLDFGLAKALDPEEGHRQPDGSLANSPTITSPALTMRGVILGTAAYMSPEQAKGRVADQRADIWAFGCVLFEMLTGIRAFRGDDVADTMVAVLTRDPDWQWLPPAVAGVRPLIARCLKRDPRQRLQAIGDARVQLDELTSTPSDTAGMAASIAAARPVGITARIGALLIGAVTAAIATWLLTRPSPLAPPVPARFEIVPAAAHALSIIGADRNIAISPDGRHIVYRGGPQDQLVVRSIDRVDVRPLEGTAGARSPFFSPDGQWVGFFDGTTLKRVSVSGGPAIPIGPSQIPRGASWGDDGTIVFGTQDTATGLLRVSIEGGEPTVLTRPDPAKGERDHVALSLLPDRRGILFTIVPSNPVEPMLVAVLDLQSGERKTLIRGGSQPEYVETGHLVYANAGTLSAVRFDLDQLEVQSDPVLVMDGVWMREAAAANYAVSRRGTLVYVPAGDTDAPRSLVWVDRTGRETPIRAPLHAYSSLRLSPDGTRVAVAVRDQQNDIHIFDLKRGTLMRLAPNPSADSSPIWTPDGQRIVFTSNRDGTSNLYSQAADGTGTVERLTTSPDAQLPSWVAPDGSGILGSEISPRTAGDVVWFPLKGPAGQSAPRAASSPGWPVERLVQSPAIDYLPEVSPNGRYIAYQSNETGRQEIYVRPFPRVNDGVWQVSIDGGTRPAWAPGGGELFYLSPSHVLTAVPVQTSGASFVFGNPTRLFGTFANTQEIYTSREYDVAADGRFLMARSNVSGDPKPASIVVVLNWFEELKATLAARR